MEQEINIFHPYTDLKHAVENVDEFHLTGHNLVWTEKQVTEKMKSNSRHLTNGHIKCKQ
jgi:hypothetical protein